MSNGAIVLESRERERKNSFYAIPCSLSLITSDDSVAVSTMPTFFANFSFQHSSLHWGSEGGGFLKCHAFFYRIRFWTTVAVSSQCSTNQFNENFHSSHSFKSLKVLSFIARRSPSTRLLIGSPHNAHRFVVDYRFKWNQNWILN